VTNTSLPRHAFFGGRIVPFEDAKVSVMTHAFLYGTACFEGIRGYWDAATGVLAFFRLRDHYERLARSCRILRIGLRYTIDDLCQLTADLARRNGDRQDVYVRPIAYKSALQIGPQLNDVEDDFTVFMLPFGKYLESENGTRCRTVSWRRPADGVIPPRAKVNGLYVNSALAKTEALDDGYDEAVMLTGDGFVAEGSTENIFLVTDGTLVTPPVTDSILVGITRDTILTLAGHDLTIPVVERRVDRTELYTADECFFSGTGAEVSPIVEIDGRIVGAGKVGPVTQRLRGLYDDVVRGRHARAAAWRYPVALD
jgi:branched-chain amino acid aminotransferase